MTKEITYSTITQQIKKLESQKLIISDLNFAQKNLELYGYSNLIKSYREPYIIKQNELIEYRSGVSFEQIHSLYILDKNLRNSVIASMLDLEEHIKEVSASVISSSFGIKRNDYLQYRNYANKNKRKRRFTLRGILESLEKTCDTTKNPIHHYIDKYNDVPPWILFKSIYFSTIINFIDLFKVNEQEELVKKLYDVKELNLPLSSLRKLMMDTLFICLEYRNIAAHGGRIYNHPIDYILRKDEIFGEEYSSLINGFSQLLFLLNLFEYKSPYIRLHKALERELTRHCSEFPQDVTYLGQTLNINIEPTDYVFISPQKNIYHINRHCSGLINAQQITLAEAQAKNYCPCKKCNKSN